MADAYWSTALFRTCAKLSLAVHVGGHSVEPLRMHTQSKAEVRCSCLAKHFASLRTVVLHAETETGSVAGTQHRSIFPHSRAVPSAITDPADSKVRSYVSQKLPCHSRSCTCQVTAAVVEKMSNSDAFSACVCRRVAERNGISCHCGGSSRVS